MLPTIKLFLSGIRWLPVLIGLGSFLVIGGGIYTVFSNYVKGKQEIAVLESQKDFIEQSAQQKISQAERSAELAKLDADARISEARYELESKQASEKNIERAKADPAVKKIYAKGNCDFPGYTLR